MTRAGIAAGIGTVLVVSGCGGGARQDAKEPSGRFRVQVNAASFPVSQTLSEHAHLRITIRNLDHRTLPDVAVTICNVTCAYPAPKGEGTSASAFGANIGQTGLANPSRPTWIVDRGPGPCGYSCRNGGAGAAVTAYSNTWALGALRSGRTVSFDWAVTAVAPGRHVIAWEIAAGLNGRARAVLGDGSLPHGSFAVQISKAPARSYVNNSGQIVQGQ